jgi:molybdate transport system permease protein
MNAPAGAATGRPSFVRRGLAPGPLGFAALGVYLCFMALLVASLATYTGLDNLLAALVSADVVSAAALSLGTATLATTACLLVAIPAGYAMAHRRLNFALETMLDLPLVLPPVAVGVGLLVFFQTRLGGFIQDNIAQFVFTRWGIVLAQFALTAGFALRLVKDAFDGLDVRFELTARTLGAGPWRAFWHVALPLARRGIATAAVLTWARAVGDFGATVLVAGATRHRTETLPIAIYLNLSSVRIEEAVAVAIVLLVFAFVALLLVRGAARGTGP